MLLLLSFFCCLAERPGATEGAGAKPDGDSGAESEGAGESGYARGARSTDDVSEPRQGDSEHTADGQENEQGAAARQQPAKRAKLKQGSAEPDTEQRAANTAAVHAQDGRDGLFVPAPPQPLPPPGGVYVFEGQSVRVPDAWPTEQRTGTEALCPELRAVIVSVLHPRTTLTVQDGECMLKHSILKHGTTDAECKEHDTCLELHLCIGNRLV